MASAPQNRTRIAPTLTLAPPVRAATPPRSAKSTSEIPEYKGIRPASGAMAVTQERQRYSKRETGSRRQYSLTQTRSESLTDAEFVAGMRALSVAWLPASRAMDRARERRRSPPVIASPRGESSAGYITNIDWRRRPRNLRPDICGPQRTRRRRIRKPRTGTATPDRRELLNHTAGNAGASVARRIGLHVVCLLVDHNTGTARVEQRSGAIAGEGNVLDCALEGALAVRADRQIRQITSVMTFWVLHAMLLVRRIEVATRRREARGIALTGFVDVDGVNSRTQICNRHRHLDAAFGCCELRLAGILTFPVLDSGCRRLALLFFTRHGAAGSPEQ